MLPFLLDLTTATELVTREEHLCDLAESLAQFGSVGCEAADLAITHRHAVQLANELLWAHDSGLAADVLLQHAALQLKLWHLAQIDNIVSKS